MPAATAPATPSVKGGIGTPIDRVDGRLKVTGRATYAAEAPIQGVAHAVLVSSVIARGKIKSIDTTLARQQAGVLRVVTPKNVAGISEPKKGDPQSGGGLREEERLPLDDWDITYAGQYVAAVVAETLEQARHAADLISIEYDSQTPVFQMQASGADSDKPKQDMGRPLQISKGDVAAVLKNADASGLTVVKQTYTTPVETHNPMEMHATVAQWDGDDKLTVWDATQYIMGVRATLASAFKLSESNVRVLCPFVGGGFGCKGAQWPHTILAAALAKMVKRPVKLMLTRQQMFTGVGHRPLTEQTLTLAAGKDGKLAAVQHASRIQGSMVGDFIEPCGIGTSRVLYETPTMEISHELSKVNIAPPTFMRAPGETPGTFALESAMDELAYALSIDPLQLRLINYAEKHPESGKPWSSKHLRECYQAGAEKFGWSKRNMQPGSMKSDEGLPLGWGMATATYPGNRFPGTARIRLI
ncbi:MAG: xanthine dehydrogenase family protein molybdopterin-binding subunit, partial [Tepidisphaeraceae bacterium]